MDCERPLSVGTHILPILFVVLDSLQLDRTTMSGSDSTTMAIAATTFAHTSAIL
jgi:hypothetical protein